MSYEEEDTCHMRRKILVRGTQGDHSHFPSLSPPLPPSLSLTRSLSHLRRGPGETDRSSKIRRLGLPPPFCLFCRPSTGDRSGVHMRRRIHVI